MRMVLLYSVLVISLGSCKEKGGATETSASASIAGTWKLISSKIISKGDTTVTFPVKDQEMIKMFTENEFAFFKHDLLLGTGATAVFDAGSGSYTLEGENYTEHLAYCNYRDWENRDFNFKLKVSNDTLVQSGIEKIDSLNINQEILEIYVKKK